MPNIGEQQEKLNKLARDVLILSRNTLLVNLRLLDAALSQFEFVPWPEGTFSTSGKYLFYNPRYVLLEYSVEKEIPVRDYLHMVMHCIFQHMYGASNLDRDLWDLACDIAVEYSIYGLKLKAATARRENEETPIFSILEKEIGKITAEKVYRYYLDQNLSEKRLKELKMVFHGDDHDAWYWTFMEIHMVLNKAGIEAYGSNGERNSGNENESEGPSDSGNSQSDEADGTSQARALQSQTWKEIAERMQVDMETFGKQRGDSAGNMLQNLQAVNREKYDYAEFLRKFAVRGEVMKINDEEFDYIFYTYGLKLYEKMPLIEPLEYKEVKRIREFVIAIDTSGSVVGEEVQAFIQKTYNVLKSTESFFSKINLHIIQCDADIQEHVKITTQDEFDAWIKTMEIKGLGGTDFRPVFSKVDELIKQHEFFNLKGLIYFTDGYGVFPEYKPAYETAFVFVNDEYENPEVPSWAIKLVLQREEI